MTFISNVPSAFVEETESNLTVVQHILQMKRYILFSVQNTQYLSSVTGMDTYFEQQWLWVISRHSKGRQRKTMHLIYRTRCHMGGKSDCGLAGGENEFVIEGRE